jgi:hypothetical protein
MTTSRFHLAASSSEAVSDRAWARQQATARVLYDDIGEPARHRLYDDREDARSARRKEDGSASSIARSLRGPWEREAIDFLHLPRWERSTDVTLHVTIVPAHVVAAKHALCAGSGLEPHHAVVYPSHGGRSWNHVKSSLWSFVTWVVGLGLLTSASCAGSEGGEKASNGCAPNAAVVCTCPDGVSRGSALCGADGAIGSCTGCPAAPTGSGGAVVAGTTASAGTGGAALPPSKSVAGTPGSGGGGGGSAGSAVVASAAGSGGAAGMAGNAAAGSGGLGAAGMSAGAGGTMPPVAAGCPPGEMCIAAPLGGVKFCSSDPAAVLPPVCPTANQACGANGKGICIDAASVGFAGLLFCVYTAC